MHFEWLHRAETSRDVIVVFGGWGTGPACLSHLTGAQDVLFARDYRVLEATLPDLSGYSHRYLIAWSFGVVAFAHWQTGHDSGFDQRIAINGTASPVHAEFGIPPRVFRRTVEQLSETSFQDFMTQCFDTPQPMQAPDIAPLRAELIAVEQRGDAPAGAWDRVWISTRDRIFPPQNQERAWAHLPCAIRRIDAPHGPFAAWSAWEEVWS